MDLLLVAVRENVTCAVRDLVLAAVRVLDGGGMGVLLPLLVAVGDLLSVFDEDDVLVAVFVPEGEAVPDGLAPGVRVADRRP